MDRFDREILDYVRSWVCYGGPPADAVMMTFGMTPEQLAARVESIVSAEKARIEQELRRPWLRVQTARKASP